MHRFTNRLRFVLLAGIALCAGVTATAAQDEADWRLCTSIAARVASQDRAVTADRPDNPFGFALYGADSLIQAPQAADEAAGDPGDNWASYHASLKARFHPDAALSAVFDQYVPEQPQIASLPGSPVRALIGTGGTMHCQTFIFFETASDGTSRLLPELTRGQNDGAFCWEESGGLARVNGRPVFLYSYHGIAHIEFQLGIVPLEGGHWGEGCRVDAKFETVYTPAQLSPPAGDPASGGEFAAAALALAHAGQFGTGTQVAFSRVPRSLRADWDRLEAASRTSVDLDWHEPSYGPLVLGGKVYFAVAAREGVGWRENADVDVALYAMRDGQMQKVGSLVLTASRGRLLSARALAGGIQP